MGQRRGIQRYTHIHQIDECCWMKNAWPVQAHALGARHYRGDSLDQNLDIYSVELHLSGWNQAVFQWASSKRMPKMNLRVMPMELKVWPLFSTAGHTAWEGGTFKGHNVARADMTWAFPQPEQSPYQLEWMIWLMPFAITSHTMK
jgi:hypothetical protein